MNIIRNIAEIDPEIYVPNTGTIREYFKKFSIQKLKKLTGLSESSIKDIRIGKSRIKLEILKKVTKNDFPMISKEIKYLVGKTNSYKIKIPNKLNKNLAYLMGAFRDGSLSNFKFEIELSQKDKKWLTLITQIIKKEFGLKAKIKSRDKDSCYYMRIRSRALFRIIEVFFGYKNKCWDTPEIIANCRDQKTLKEYVSGFWDAEGSYTGILCQCWYETNKCPPLDFIKKVLAKDGINVTIHNPQKTTNYYCHRLYIPYKSRVMFRKKYHLRYKNKYPFTP